MALNVDKILEEQDAADQFYKQFTQILDPSEPKITPCHLDEVNLVRLLRRLQAILIQEDNVVYLQSPIYIVGDIHGQLFDLFQLFETCKRNEGTEKLDDLLKNKRFLFMGDYVDRGYQSMETFAFLAFLKVKYPENVYLLRGNHECRQVNQMYGFFSDCQLSYGNSGIWFFCNEVFDLLPLSAVVDDEIYSVHGGLSPRIQTISKILTFNRRIELPNDGPLADLTWSDPSENVQTFTPNSRGAGYLFGATQVERFCHINKIKLITRSHQMALQGFDYPFVRNNSNPCYKLITVWSAPNYTYRSDNWASVLYIENFKDPKDIKKPSNLDQERCEESAKQINKEICESCEGDSKSKFLMFAEHSRSKENPNDSGAISTYFA